MSAFGLAVAAAVAISGTPGLGVASDEIAPHRAHAPSYQVASYVQPVRVALLGGLDAIRWQSSNITSSPAGSDGDGAPALQAFTGAWRATSTQPNAAGILVGQNVGALGALPGKIQLMHPVASLHITSPYGWRHNPTGPGTQIHVGQDYAIPCGSPVYASADGVVIQSAWAGHSGMRVTIDHGSSIQTGYSHNSQLIAKVGDTVKQWQVIALSGTTGNSTGCHVHFEVIINGRWNDPRNFLPGVFGQPNPMIDSRNTTIAAEPIRNSGAPRSSVEETINSSIRWVTAPRVRTSSPTPNKSKSPAVAPKADPKPAKKPTATAKPSTPTKPRTEPKPAPTKPSPTKSTTKPAPTSAAPKPAPTSAAPKPAPTKPAPTSAVPSTAPPTSAAPTSAAPTSAAPTKAAPTKAAPTTAAAPTTTPAPTTAAPTSVAPTTAAPTSEAPAPSSEAPPQENQVPDVNELPDLQVTLPESGAADPSGDTTKESTEPDAPKADVKPEVDAPQDGDSTSKLVVGKPAKKDSKQEAVVAKKVPAVKQPPAKQAPAPAAKPELKKVKALKKVATPVKAKPKKIAVVAAAKPKAAATQKAVAKVVTVTRPKPLAPKAPVPQMKMAAVPPKQETVKPIAQKSLAETGGEAGTDK
ncbi:peptidoglycan DD-metalloendopeptidase family protein [Paeniglutamicibacter sp. ANT13_2]|uniref:Peptidoglycan DD-metalloendopeptidase family protein n=1 Tax=Paeniglutamicibacter terrestris TaxID=2723403 RepID=A0ABX1G4M9_9MICC|nr:peptidoglycan DD-metalloendopeptidase family protein [Paeniglutamicibacter terrestris]